MIPVFCLTCGAELRREDDHRDAEAWPCYRWLTTAGAPADRCPGCGTVTSKLSTTPAPDLAAVGRMAYALHFLCAAVRCNYDPATIRAAGYLDAGLAALRAAGWDPDQGRPWLGDPGGAPDLAADVDFAAILGQFSQLPPSDRALLLDLVDRLLEDATPEGPGAQPGATVDQRDASGAPVIAWPDSAGRAAADG